MNTVGVTTISTSQVLIGTGISAPPIRIWRQEIDSPRGSIGPQKFRNAYPFKTSINHFSPKHGHSTPTWSKVIGRKTVPDESSNVYLRKSIDFGSNYVVAKSPNLMDFRLSPSNTPDKINSIIAPTTRFGRFINGSDWLASSHDVEEVTVERVSKEKAYSGYIIKKISLKL